MPSSKNEAQWLSVEERAEKFVETWFNVGTPPHELPDERGALKEWLIEELQASEDFAATEGAAVARLKEIGKRLTCWSLDPMLAA